MRFIISFIVVSILSLIAQAQTVEKVSGDQATVAIQGSERLQVGDKVSFLNDRLDISGQGEVTKVSDGGKRALVKIISGSARAGMSLEKKSVEAASAPAPRASEAASAYLDEEDRRVLRIGEISQTRYIVGGILGTYPLGLGIGHAVQGRYSDKGWIFTVGELGSMAVFLAGIGDCWSAVNSRYEACNGGLMTLGFASYVGFRIWEIVDVWAAPPEINRRYRELKLQMKPTVSFSPLLAPTKDGAIAGFRMTF